MSSLNESENTQALRDEIEKLRAKVETAEKKQKEAEKMLAFLKASADAMPNPIFIKNDELRFVFFNRAYREFFGLKENENIGKKVTDLEYLSESDRERYQREDTEMLEKQTIIQYEAFFDVPQKDLEEATQEETTTESLYWSKGFRVPETGACGVIGEIVDISKEKKLQRELTRSLNALEILARDAKTASKTDPVTKLYNRNVLADEVPYLTEKAAEANKPVCVMLMDIDHFKQINDTYGHPYGDEILQSFAEILTKSFRQSDIAIRYGGDEFMIVLYGANLAQAEEIAGRICNTVRDALMLPDGKAVTVSIGVTERKKEDNLLSFTSRADEALYLAKRAGRNRVSVKE